MFRITTQLVLKQYNIPQKTVLIAVFLTDMRPVSQKEERNFHF